MKTSLYQSNSLGIAEKGEKTPFGVIAGQQTAGRGQWGRKWDSPVGGLYLSLALTVDLAVTEAPHLTLFSGVGIVQNLEKYQIPVQLKWPNDLVVHRKKLGGIKAETKVYQDKITQAVIGVGINWTNAVPKIGINLQSLANCPIFSLEELAAVILDGLGTGYNFYLSQGIEPLLSSYVKHLQNYGQIITVDGYKGIIVGVNPQGALKVRLETLSASTEICLPIGTISLGYDSTEN